jgi:hypothetical protein
MQLTALTTGTSRTAAVLAAVGFLAIAAFQVALALGTPLGRASWGGRHLGRLPVGLRLASAAAVAVWVLAAMVVLARSGFGLSWIPEAVARWGTWVLVGVMPLAALMNLASPSRWERFLWGPVALILAVLCFLVARGPAP